MCPWFREVFILGGDILCLLADELIKNTNKFKWAILYHP